ncbi:hypothetical protein AB834_03690 [PVC group bacterium (ex Bugula neritina AB1)]|nr:hypothetical protein AB834_03690 [PVC group bacterium (ex Bugula neritina AB1)]
MKNSLFYTSPITYNGFKSCVKYAEAVFDSELGVSVIYTRNNFKLQAIPDFIGKVKAFDSHSLINKPNGFSLFIEFKLFKNSILSGNVPDVQLNVPEIRITMLTLIYYMSSDVANNLACCNVLDKYDISNPLFFEEASFFKVNVGNVSIPFRVVKFVLLTTLEGISSHNQASTIHYTGDITQVLSKASLSKIHSIVNVIRATFFEGPQSRFYLISKYLQDLFERSDSSFFQYSSILKFNLINVETIYYNYLSFDMFEKSDLKVRVPFFTADSKTFFSKSSPKDFAVLKAYSDFLVIGLYQDLLYNEVASKRQLSCFRGIGPDSFIVNANKVKSLEKYFKLSFNRIREKHYDFFKPFYINQGLVSPAEYSERIDKSLLKSNYSISFYRNNYLFLSYYINNLF